jgi:SET family sugar efflux transporter-like MFS transporter
MIRSRLRRWRGFATADRRPASKSDAVTAATTGLARRIRSRALGPLAVVFFAVGLSTALSFPFLSLFLTSAVHADPIELSVFLLAQPLSGVVLSTVLGRLSDGRLARRRVLMAAAVAGCAGAGLFSVLRSYWPLLLVACTVTAVGAALMPQGFAYARAILVGDPTAPMVTSTLRTFFSLSWVAGPPLAALLLTAGGFTTLYACSTGLYAIVFVVVVLWLVEPPAAKPLFHNDETDIGLPADGARRSLWITLAALVLLQSSLSLNVQAVPLLVRHNLHAGVGSAGLVLGMCAAIEIPAMLGFGVLSTRVPLQLLVRIGPLFGIAYFALASVAEHVWQLGAAQLLNACFIAVIQGLAISYVQELLPLQPGRASTLYSNTFPCGAILASPLVGIGAKFGYRISFLAAIGLAAGGLVLLTVGRPSQRCSTKVRPADGRTHLD